MPNYRRLTIIATAAAIVVAMLPAVAAAASPLATAVGSSASVMCNDVPPYCDPVDGTIHDGSGMGTIPQVPGDPTPGANGMWLGHYTSSRYCYANYNSFVVDTDNDWLDDQCEFTLARAFAPVLAMNPLDGCPGGEPFWAAKYFPNSIYGWGDFVRIAYMPSYYRDCGNVLLPPPLPSDTGHDGDSEFIRITVHYNEANQHWEVRDAFTSAHAGTITDSSDWLGRDDLSYPTRRYAYPQVWVSRAKHANYRSQQACNAGAVGFDTCEGNVAMGKMRVYKHRNVGSRFVDRFPAGAMSENSLYRSPFTVEYFYYRRAFRGWQVGASGVTPYYYFLNSIIYDCYFYAAGNCYLGPGPNPPTWTRTTGVIDGPPQVTAFQTSTWTTFVTGGQLPYTAQWWRRYASESTPVLLGSSSGGSAPFSAGSRSITVDRCENFTLTMKVTAADGQYWYDDHAVSVLCPPPPLTVYIAGPGIVTSKGTYTYTAVHSGFSGPTFTWSERFCEDWSGSSCSAWASITGLGATFNRVLNKDCGGTGERTFEVMVVVRNTDGREVTAEQTTSLCGLA